MQSKNYHDYVIKNGKFIGNFEEMYQNVEDPWHCKDALNIEYDMALYLIDKYKICLKEEKILDIGCGKGAFTARIAKLRPQTQILAADISPTAIKKAKQKYGFLPNITFKVIDIQKEYKNLNEKFDLIIISQMMWYILLDFRTIMNYLIKNVLKKNSCLLISQAFYKSEEQKYGNEIVQTSEDMLGLIKLGPIEMIETNRLKNHNAVILFKNE